MTLGDYHIHTTFSDGKNNAEDMILSAIDMGLKKIGISDHSFTPFDAGYCMHPSRLPEYLDTIHALREKYRDSIDVYCGIEYDIYSDVDISLFDYVIGSVHYVYKDGEYISIDMNADVLRRANDRHYNGDVYSLVFDYYDNLKRVVDITHCDIIGHFDLVSKFIEISDLIDIRSPRYIEAWKSAADALLPYNIPFEINSGAISRGYRTTPYPDTDIYDYLRSRGARFVLSSDSHSRNTIAFQFDRWQQVYSTNVVEFK